MHREIHGCTHVGRAHPDREIKLTIHVRRHVGHDRIPEHHEFVGCPQRPRLSIEEFAQRYGSCDEDVNKVKSFCLDNGLRVHDHHHARRHVVVSGSVAQLEAMFGVELHDYHKHKPFHFPDVLPILPDHLSEIIVHVGLGEIPREKIGGVYVPPNSTNFPPNAPIAAVNGITPAQVAARYNCPLNGTGQTCAIGIEYIIYGTGQQDGTPDGGTPTNLPFGYSRTDVAQTLAAWGVAMPTITDISIDGINNNVNTSPAGEWTFDICMAAAFAPGANIAVYFQGTESALNQFTRIVHPHPGDPICHTMSQSAVYPDEATLFRDQPTLAAALDQLGEDAMLQSVTWLAGSGDWGSGGLGTDGKSHCAGSTFANQLCIGGTTIGFNGPTLVEWLWLQSVVGDEAIYLVGAGGGASAYVPIPHYQSHVTFSKSLNNNFAGRGVPDIAAIAGQQYTVFMGGQAQSFGGTSQSLPSMNGIIASINTSLGYPVGFLNPTLYAFSGAIRDINPGNTVGGPQSNKCGLVIAANGTPSLDARVPGYPITNGYDCCNGLGVLMGNALIAAIQPSAIFRAFRNGQPTASNEAVQMLYWNKVIYYQDILADWYRYDGSSTFWTFVGADPRTV